MNKISFKISNIHCDACTKLISRKLAKLDGVSGISIGLDGVGNIISDSKLNMSDLKKVLEGTDYKILSFNN